MIDAGEIIGGKYRVLRPIGEGGMGIVVAAEHVHVSEPVAIKLLKPDAVTRPEMLARFVREARTAMKLKSEHVVRVFDVDMLGDSRPYIVMELLDGRDLATVIADDGPIAVRVAIDWVLQTCESLAEAHALGVVHRDLKPANLFLTKRPDGSPSIKVLDFGVSKVAWATDDVGATTEPSSDPRIAIDAPAQQKPGLTNTNATLGSPRYMSPEQLRSARDVDTRADIWALGATLFEMLTGRPPFVGATTEEITARIRTANAPALRTLRPAAPGGLEAVLEKCLRKNPDERHVDVSELASALAPFGTDEAARSAVRVRATLGLEAPRRRRRVPRTGVAIATGVIALVALAIVGRPRAPATTTTPNASAPIALAIPSTSERVPTVERARAEEAPAPSTSPATTRARVRGAATIAARPDAALDPVHAFDDPE